MMKKTWKILALTVCLCLLAGCVTACGSAGTKTRPGETAAPTQTAPAEETAPPETPAEETGPSAGTGADDTRDGEDGTVSLITTSTAGGRAVVYLPAEIEVVTDGSYEEMGWQLAAMGGDVLILGAREDRAMFEENGIEFPENMLEYIVFLSENNEFPNEFSSTDGGRFYTTYEGTLNGERTFYYLLLAQGDDAWWMVHFVCPAETREDYEPWFEFYGSMMELS